MLLLEVDDSQGSAPVENNSALVMDALPVPLPVSMEFGFNTIPTLLEQFPLPKAIVGYALPPNEAALDEEQMDNVVNHLSECVKQFAMDECYNHLVVQATRGGLDRSPSGGRDASDSIVRGGAAHDRSPCTVAIQSVQEAMAVSTAPAPSTPHSRRANHLVSTSRRGTSWERQDASDGARMTLRPRNTERRTSTSAAAASVTTKPRSTRTSTEKPAPPPAVPAQSEVLVMSRVREPTHSEEQCTSSGFAVLLQSKPSDISCEILLQTATSLQSDPAPLKDADQTTLLGFLRELSAMPSGSAESCTDEYRSILQNLLALRCVTHPSFPSATADISSVVDSVITAFLSLANYISQKGGGEAPISGADISSLVPPSFHCRNSLQSFKKYLFHLLELLRSYLSAILRLVYCPARRVITELNLHRLEEATFRCLFVTPRRMEKAFYKQYTTYTVEPALRLYRAVWNHLDSHRSLSDEFFGRLVVEDEVIRNRCYRVDEENKLYVMPLTVAVLGAAQSQPESSDGVLCSSDTSNWMVTQCSEWVEAVKRELIDYSSSMSSGRVGKPLPHQQTAIKESAAARLQVFIQLLEDAAVMAGDPEWPVADMFCRAALLSLSHVFRADSLMTPSSNSTGATSPLLPIAVDAVSGVLRILLSDRYGFLLQAPQHTEQHLASMTRDLLSEVMPTSSCSVALPGSPASDEGDSPPTSAALKERTRVTYIELSSVADAGSVFAASEWSAAERQGREARVASWLWLHGSLSSPIEETPPATEGKTEAPVMRVATADQIRRLHVLVSAQSSRGVFHDSMRQYLISLLLSTLNTGEAADAVAVDVSTLSALRKALGFLSELVLHFPYLSKIVWPNMRKHVQHPNAKVRESVIALLSTLLSVTLKPEMSAFEDKKEASADVLSSLLHLLEDENLNVVSRVIITLERFLTDLSLSVSLCNHGENPILFIESKLLLLVTHPDRRSADAVRVFIKRWLSSVSDSPTDSTFTAEVEGLLHLHAGVFPYEVTIDNLVCTLLTRIWSEATTQAKDDKPKKTAEWSSGSCSVSAIQPMLMQLGRSAYSRFESATEKEDLLLSLCMLQTLARVHAKLVEPFADVLLQHTLSSMESGSATETDGGCILHICLLLKELLSSDAPGRQMLPLDKVATTLTQVISRYAGPLQQRVIHAACAALTAMISPSAASGSDVYLRHCYGMMNLYYTQLKGLLPTLTSNVSHASYAQRLLFLLSEFLRLHRGWRVCSGGLATYVPLNNAPNLLALNGGICQNIFSLITDLERSTPLNSYPKLYAMVLRTIASLCIVDPATFFYRCESNLKAALSCSAPDFIRAQGLQIIRDFLVDESSRVEISASKCPRDLLLHSEEGTIEEDDSASLTPQRKSTTRKRKRGREETQEEERSHPNLSLVCTVEDENSGMSLWILSTFSSSILEMVSHKSPAVRQLCLQILERTSRDGLLPPMMYADSLMLLMMDSSESIRRSAEKCVLASAQGQWREDCLLTAAIRASSRGADFLCATQEGVDLIHTAFRRSSGHYVSAWQGHFQLLKSVKSRQFFVSRILQHFYVNDKMKQWCEEHQRSRDGQGGEAVCTAVAALCHMAVAVALLDLSRPLDYAHFVSQCIAGIDLQGQSALADASVAVEQKDLLHQEPMFLYRAIGVLCLSTMATYMTQRSEAALSKARLARLSKLREQESTEAFIRKISEYALQFEPLTASQFAKSQTVALNQLKAALESVVSSKEHFQLSSFKSNTGHARRAKQPAAARKRQRPSALREEECSDADDSAADDGSSDSSSFSASSSSSDE